MSGTCTGGGIDQFKLQLNEREAESFEAQSAKHHYTGTLLARAEVQSTAFPFTPLSDVPTFAA
jgi:hypothetical protein